MPVIILTARGDEIDKVRGLRIGADDYLTKPFSLLEFVARVEALFRRGGLRSNSQKIAQFGSVIVDPAKRTVTKQGQPIELAPMEFDLLLALARRNGAIATRRELLEEVWGYEHDVASRTVDTHILELRRKLESDPAQPRHILTARKLGYRLQP